MIVGMPDNGSGGNQSTDGLPVARRSLRRCRADGNARLRPRRRRAFESGGLGTVDPGLGKQVRARARPGQTYMSFALDDGNFWVGVAKETTRGGLHRAQLRRFERRHAGRCPSGGGDPPARRRPVPGELRRELRPDPPRQRDRSLPEPVPSGAAHRRHRANVHAQLRDQLRAIAGARSIRLRRNSLRRRRPKQTTWQIR